MHVALGQTFLALLSLYPGDTQAVGRPCHRRQCHLRGRQHQAGGVEKRFQPMACQDRANGWFVHPGRSQCGRRLVQIDVLVAPALDSLEQAQQIGCLPRAVVEALLQARAQVSLGTRARHAVLGQVLPEELALMREQEIQESVSFGRCQRWGATTVVLGCVRIAGHRNVLGASDRAGSVTGHPRRTPGCPRLREGSGRQRGRIDQGRTGSGRR